jgi:hypothetical protein
LLTEADRAAIAVHKVAILDLLGAEAVETPAGTCGLCGGVLAWTEDWPSRGAGAWLCLHCSQHTPMRDAALIQTVAAILDAEVVDTTPTLAEVYAELTTEERERLQREAAGGDVLAGRLLRLLGVGPMVEG